MRKLVFVIALSALAAPSAMAADAAAAVPAFEKIKALAGEWRGQDPAGKPVTISYAVTSGGAAVLETSRHADGGEMISVYHLDKGDVMMTHYCSLNNQPRMRGKSDGQALTFSMVDATNLAGPDAPHMHRLVLRFDDATHLTEEWSMHAGAKDDTMAFRLERVGK